MTQRLKVRIDGIKGDMEGFSAESAAVMPLTTGNLPGPPQFDDLMVASVPQGDFATLVSFCVQALNRPSASVVASDSVGTEELRYDLTDVKVASVVLSFLETAFTVQLGLRFKKIRVTYRLSDSASVPP